MELEGIIPLFFLVTLIATLWAVSRLFLYFVDSAGNARTRNVLARLRSKRCLRCGYDMRSSAWRCPECGWQRGGTPEQVAALNGMSDAPDGDASNVDATQAPAPEVTVEEASEEDVAP